MKDMYEFLDKKGELSKLMKEYKDNKSNNKTSKHKASSIAEFLYKNIHLFGFENFQRVFNVYFRELMDNSLDAFMDRTLIDENSKALIDIHLKRDPKTNWWTLDWFDSGCGIPYQEVPFVVCQLLYGSKFDSTEIARGQQGLGCTSLMLWSQKTTDTSCLAIVKNLNDENIYGYKLKTNIKKNEPEVLKSFKCNVESLEDLQIQKNLDLTKHQVDLLKAAKHGTFLRFTFKASYVKSGFHSPLYLLRLYRYLNPEVEINYLDSSSNTKINYLAFKSDYSRPNLSVKKIPRYVELGDLNNLKDGCVYDVIKDSFEISESNLKKSLEETFMHKKRAYESLSSELRGELLRKMVKNTVLEKPHFIDTCVNEGLINVVTQFGEKHFDSIMTASSEPKYFAHGALFVTVYAFYGQKLSTQNIDSDSKIELIRVANDTPLIYGAHNCVIYKSVSEFNWNKLKIQHSKGELPKGSLKLVVSVKATKIPYATESKDYISNDATIRDSITEALELIGSKLRKYRNKLKVHAGRAEKAYVLTKILPEILVTLGSLKNYCSSDFVKTNDIHEESYTSEILNPFENRLVVSNIMDSLTIFVDKELDMSVCLNKNNERKELEILNKNNETHFKKDLILIGQNPNTQVLIPFALNLKKHIFKDYSSLEFFLVESDLKDLKTKENEVSDTKENEVSDFLIKDTSVI